MTGLIHVATMAAHAAGRLVMRSYDRLDRIKVTEKAPHDFVSNVDQEAEQVIIEHIHKYYPGHAVLSEEAGAVPPRSVVPKEADMRWIVDPIDGTTNFIRGVPHFCISIAVEKAGEIICGVVYDPVRDETFQAEKGQGALLNQKRLKLTSHAQLEGRALASGFPRRSSISLTEQMAILMAVTESPATIRRMGSAALDLVYVASGRWNGFWGADLKLWDIAAGLLIAAEAGAGTCDFSGNPISPEVSGLIVAPLPFLPELQALIAGAR